ncbi:MAG: hypothetical protein IKJ31_08090 [Bacteroidaceae bacterium]|nr:hypothetical protein [Bacteroidaceae bacterium]
MKHLIRDLELIAYLEGELNKEEIRILKRKLEENGELNMLYHLQLSYDEGLEEYANELIGEDDFNTESVKTIAINHNFDSEYIIAANKKNPKKE